LDEQRNEGAGRGRNPAILIFPGRKPEKSTPAGFGPPTDFIFFVSTKKTKAKESDPNASACRWQVPSTLQIFDALAKLAYGSNIPRLIAKYPLRSSGGKGGGWKSKVESQTQKSRSG